MSTKNAAPLDIAVIGGGPAGISACLELSDANLKVALFENDDELGGIPRTERMRLFGMRDLKRLYRGTRYAQKLDRLIRNTSVEIHTGSTVRTIIPGDGGEDHLLEVVSPEGSTCYRTRFIILATGCFESNRISRLISGTRPAGIFTTGAIKELVNVHHAKPGERALLIGSEHVIVSCVLTPVSYTHLRAHET